MNQPPTLRVDQLSLAYLARSGEQLPVVKEVSFQVAPGDVLGIAGESGCGKSTLGTGCIGLVQPPLQRLNGAVQAGGRLISDLGRERHRREVLGRQLSLIPQGANSALNPTLRVSKLAADVLRSHHRGMKEAEIRDRLKDRLATLGLGEDRIADAFPCELSGGMRQRVVIALSTLMNPAVLVADEPTSALDVITQKSVISTILRLMSESVIKSLIFITHELPLLRNIANRIAVMYAGEFVEYGETEQVLRDPLHPYTKALLGATLDPFRSEPKGKPAALLGTPPKLTDAPLGCSFAPRCPFAEETCRTTRQQLKIVRDRQVRCCRAG